MYQSLYNFAKSRGLTASMTKEGKRIRARIVVDENGNLDHVHVIANEDTAKVLCPSLGTLAQSSGGAIRYAAPICEKLEVVLSGVSDKKDNVIKNEAKYAAWKQIMKEAADADGNLLPVYRFIEKADADPAIKQQIYEQVENAKAAEKGKAWISFAIMPSSGTNGMQNVEAMTTWEEWYERWLISHGGYDDGTSIDDSGMVVSAVTGRLVKPVPAKQAFPKMATPTGTIGANTGSYVGSFATNAFESYGFVKNQNLPVSMEEALAIKAGADYLVTSDINHVDFFNVLYWFDQDATDMGVAVAGYFKTMDNTDAAGESDDSDVAAKKAATVERRQTDALKGNIGKSSGKNNVFHTMHYKITALGRMYYSDERSETYGELYDALKKWQADTMVYASNYVKSDDAAEDGTATYKVTGQVNRSIKSVTAILNTFLHVKDIKSFSDRCAQWKKEYGTSRAKLFGSVCFGDNVPNVFYERALRAATIAMASGKSAPVTVYQTLKVYLIRNGGMTMLQPELNGDIKDTAYICGRMFAVIEKLQADSAGGKINAPLGVKFYALAKSYPVAAMTELYNRVPVYVRRLHGNSKKNAAVFYEKLLQDLSCMMESPYPRSFTKIEQGMFDLGYYQQKNDLWKKKSDKDMAATNADAVVTNDVAQTDAMDVVDNQ